MISQYTSKTNFLEPGHTYHRFVKTTPKPKATKKSSGELVGPPPPPPPPPPDDGVGSWGVTAVEVGADDDIVGSRRVILQIEIQSNSKLDSMSSFSQIPYS